jgi:hypothetical protein
MPKFKMSYAFDVPYYFDFTVEAKTSEEAEKKAKKALRAGVFDKSQSQGDADYSSSSRDRVFLNDHDPIPEGEESDRYELVDGKLVDTLDKPLPTTPEAMECAPMALG